MNIKRTYRYLFLALAFSACAIENDIPYPIVEAAITALEVEGQCDADGNSSTQTTLNKASRTATLYVDDSVNPAKLRIKKFLVSNDATIVANPAVCNNFAKFPTSGFESLASIAISSDTRMDFSSPVEIILRTYQDYQWTINVRQIINREIILENQIGKAVVDDANRSVVIYVAKSQPLDKIKVSAFNLGGAHGSVVPDPTSVASFDFSRPAQFFVSRAWEEISYKWTVYVYQKEGETSATASIFPMATSATLSGSIQSGKQPIVEYKKANDNNWNALPSSAIEVNGTSFSASFSSLVPATAYQCRISIDGTAGSVQTFSTTPATPLTDGSFDNWYKEGKLWNPWSAGGTSFWDTGNRGAITISESNSIPTDETSSGSGQAALLESKYLTLKFAAGNIFTGSYLNTVGTNGVLSFGRPFTTFPSKLRVRYKYNSAIIDKVGDDNYSYLKGRPDSCHIYIALTDWNEPLEIRTRVTDRQLFDKSDTHIIAYAELIQGASVGTYQQVDLTLQYQYSNRRPRYIVVVASASKYGDFFTGGVGSKLWADNFELIYE